MYLLLENIGKCYYLDWHLNFTGAFDDDDVIHVEDDVNPVRDLEIISEELRKKVGMLGMSDL